MYKQSLLQKRKAPSRDAQSRIIAYFRIILKFISESRISNPILEFSTRFFLLLFLLKISLIKITAVKNCNEEHWFHQYAVLSALFWVCQWLIPLSRMNAQKKQKWLESPSTWQPSCTTVETVICFPPTIRPRVGLHTVGVHLLHSFQKRNSFLLWIAFWFSNPLTQKYCNYEIRFRRDFESQGFEILFWASLAPSWEANPQPWYGRLEIFFIWTFLHLNMFLNMQRAKHMLKFSALECLKLF